MSKRFCNGVFASVLSLAMWVMLVEGSISAYAALMTSGPMGYLVASLD